MTTRVDGDELAKSFAIFDVTKQISTTLGKLVKKIHLVLQLLLNIMELTLF